MAFSARRGGAWSNSPLPSTSSKSSKLRKPRRRVLLRDFFLGNFFTIGISLSLSLFLLFLICFGVPPPFSSSSRRLHFSKSHPIRRHHHLPRHPRNKPSSSADVITGESIVDVTTKELYDRIGFEDEDGGPWKQGWRVEYRGDEWDREKLKVFVVPHSHNDPGWKLTVDEYYQRKSRHILDTIVATLSKDARRKFIWEEMSYLERWWKDSSEDKREMFTNLVQNGQLEIVGGGWVMNDEV